MTNRVKSFPDIDAKNVICTSYFRTKRDPQHNIYVPEAYKYMQPWYESVNTLCKNNSDIKGVIFYSGLSDEFVKQYENDKIIFIPCELGKYTTNDERFFCYYDFLNQYEAIQKCFFTDISDVKVKKNPFEFVIGDKLYVGKDMDNTPRIEDNPWAVQKANQFVQAGDGKIQIEKIFGKMPLFNAGVIGGRREICLEQFRLMCNYFEIVDNENNNNMMCLHYVIWKHGDPVNGVVSGKPLTSGFKRFEESADVYFVHK